MSAACSPFYLMFARNLKHSVNQYPSVDIFLNVISLPTYITVRSESLTHCVNLRSYERIP